MVSGRTASKGYPADIILISRVYHVGAGDWTRIISYPTPTEEVELYGRYYEKDQEENAQSIFCEDLYEKTGEILAT